jgi:hypothetical protein
VSVRQYNTHRQYSHPADFDLGEDDWFRVYSLSSHHRDKLTFSQKGSDMIASQDDREIAIFLNTNAESFSRYSRHSWDR